MKKLDTILLSIIIFVLNCIWLSYLFDRIEITVFIAFLLLILFYSIIVHLKNRYDNKKVISIEDAFTIFAMDRQRVLDHFVKLFPESANPYIEDGYIIFENNKMLLLQFTFSEIGLADISKAFNFANINGIEKVIILTNKISRKTLIFANRLPISFIYYDKFKLYKKLKLANALPESFFIYNKNKSKLYLSNIFSEIFNKKRAKYFLFTSLLLIFTSFFTPMKLYYNILITLSLVCSIVCLMNRT